MKAFIVDRYSKTTLLREGELPDPELRPDEVLVEVHATSVNPLDFKIRNGDFKLFMPARPPFALGHDVAGVVVRVSSISKLGMRFTPVLMTSKSAHSPSMFLSRKAPWRSSPKISVWKRRHLFRWSP